MTQMGYVSGHTLRMSFPVVDLLGMKQMTERLLF